MQRHPILFPADEIVEVDECHLQCLQKRGATSDTAAAAAGESSSKAKGPKVWIIGCVGRDTKWVSLDVAPNHQTATIQPLIDAHLPHSSTILLADKDKSFLYLKKRHTFHQSEKRKTTHGNGLYVKTYYASGPGRHGRREFPVHTNTIEGYWALFRERIGNQDESMIDILLSECMFRSLRIPITPVLQV